MSENKDILLQQLLDSPKLEIYVKELNALLEEERGKRNAFYNVINEDDKAEFINGKIVMHSPVMRRHFRVCIRLATMLDTYIVGKELGELGVEKCMIELSRNSYEPDICFFEKEKATRFTDEQMIFPAPDFIVEILSKSTEANDRTIKYLDYAAHGVTEYWIIDPRSEVQTVEQYLLDETNKEYALNIKANSGKITSKAISGFSISVAALFDDVKYKEVLKLLSQ